MALRNCGEDRDLLAKEKGQGQLARPLIPNGLNISSADGSSRWGSWEGTEWNWQGWPMISSYNSSRVLSRIHLQTTQLITPHALFTKQIGHHLVKKWIWVSLYLTLLCINNIILNILNLMNSGHLICCFIGEEGEGGVGWEPQKTSMPSIPCWTQAQNGGMTNAETSGSREGGRASPAV